ncbi:1-acyl-sn-glycerol-3-phosphate acyltransferases [Pseudomonas jinjuensis]|uniref:1-acyl-sn-glycerol-3-phosphate acyltransferases n=3 Tax=Pseudomonas jinjuensis TaxID=198616 RepID=A0A1H0QJB0_9PSED|nr:1-acyl-sn-glycerol-3-phosphate acyltransferases [Pseudomonas jinjuensis]
MCNWSAAATAGAAKGLWCKNVTAGEAVASRGLSMPFASDDTRVVPGPDGTTERLLAIVRQVVAELRPQDAASLHIGLDSRLEDDLGVDSLGRAELWSRLEREFGVHLPEAAFGEAETLHDLLQALGAGGRRETPSMPGIGARTDEPADAGTPERAQTLIEVLQWHLSHHPQRTQVHLLGEGDSQEDISYAALHQGALAVACGLQRHGLRGGERVALMLPTGRDFLHAFLGVMLAGGVPVPIYPPMRLNRIEEHLQRQAAILANAEARALITVPEARMIARLLRAQVPSLGMIASVAELSETGGSWTEPQRQAQDLAFLQYTSGSTGQPKGVMVSHANLLANLRAMGSALRVTADDVFVSWLPMYHDMGLIGAWFGSLYYAFPLVLMSPLAFLARPARWLWSIHEHRGTLSAAPNFAYELCLNRLDDAQLEGLDLSSWRLALNGAEPVNPDTLQRFAERFARYGLAPGALMPVYGLAEATLDVTLAEPGRGPLIDHVQRDAFQSRGRALRVEPDSPGALRFVSCGHPLPGHQVRIVDDRGIELPERREGHLQFRGPSTTAGYFRNPQESARVRDGDWVDSQDLGYIAAGELYLSGRVKDLIIRGGRNIYPYDVENAVGNLPGLRKGCVAVFGCTGAAGGERLVVLAETREQKPGELERLRQAITRLCLELTGTAPDDIVLAPPHSVLKTSSGKIRRAASRELYERGELGRAPPAAWRQLLRLVRSVAGAQLRRGWQALQELFYAAWFWGLLMLIGSLTWLTVALLPSPDWCRRLARRAARGFLYLVGVPLRADGLGRLYRGEVRVLVANHASYLDGLALCAALPPRFSFVAKRELAGQLVAGTFLRRLGTCFVERFDPRRSAADAEVLAEALQRGQSLLFFPEGTLTREPGLMPFRMGAFVLAARADVPLVPVAIRGSRMLLRDGQWFPHHGELHVSVCPQLLAGGRDWLDAIRLRDQARAVLLQRLDEPDRLRLAG